MTVTLGFAEPIDEEFHSESFPSKIGGQPRWIDPQHPLNVSQATCDECQKPMALLMQLYAPEDEPIEAFHRMLYVFVCRTGSCHRASPSRCMRVFRAQLAEENTVYEEVGGAADEDDIAWAMRSSVKPAKQCVVCGMAGTKACSKCHERMYCSRDHQLADWEVGHRAQCGSGEGEGEDHARRLRNQQYPELLIVSEEEEFKDKNDDFDDEDDGSDSESEDEIQPEDGAMVPVTNEKAVDSEVDVDKAFLMFQRRIQQNSDQVIRYARAPGAEPGQPLYVSDAGIPEDVPGCELCGAQREFEFQIMPQMLNFLGLKADDPTSIDWGTLLVYSCPNSCDVKDAQYAREVIYRQHFSSQGIGDKYM
ncbi:hypothetical protein FBU59_004874, partial [Linderina macrospora]